MNFKPCIFALATLATAAFAAWDGTSALPKTTVINDTSCYEITTPEEFVGYIAIVDSSCTGLPVCGVLKNDIVFGEDTSKTAKKYWQIWEVCHPNVAFKGEGHTIYGVHVNRSIFLNVGGIYKGYVKDVTLAHADISGSGFIGQNDGGVIENVEVRNSNIHNADYHAAGVVTYHNYNDMHPGVIRNVRSVKNGVSGKGRVGGVVASSNGMIRDAYNSSGVYPDLSGEEVEGGFYIGGVVGIHEPMGNDSTYDLIGLMNEGEVIGIGHEAVFAGGIVGYTTRSVKNSRNTGTIKGESYSDYAMVGGIVGFGFGFNTYSNLSNAGKVTAKGYDSTFAGGIVGYARYVEGDYLLNQGDVEAINAGPLGQGYAGGIAALLYQSTMSRMGNWGNVESHSMGNAYAGGVVALNYRGSKFDFALNYGSVKGVCDNPESEKSNVEVGGVVGFSYDTEIAMVYNRGDVYSDAAKGDWSYAGGLVGKAYSSNANVRDGYNAAKVTSTKHAAGLVAYFRYASYAKNLFLDTVVMDLPVFADTLVFENNGMPLEESFKRVGTDTLKSTPMYLHFNSMDPDYANQWVKKDDDGYPVFTFDSTGMTIVPEDTVVVDTTAKDTSVVDTLPVVPQDTLVKDTVVKDTVKQDSVAKDTTDRLFAGNKLHYGVKMQGKNLVIRGMPGAEVQVFSLQGKLVARKNLDFSGSVEVRLPANSTYIVRVK